jgi:phosphate transport system permease protein
MFFTVKDTVSGLPIADFREWWRQTTGETYDSRNSLVVGFVMGFAVIPIVFTIAEDSLSNVPDSLISGSLALGASRWQTVWSVVVPTAISGIVSAIMIGFGRAIGETMIVVMATGNTAVMETNPFSGMRTLSANIAVELPEAAVGHTHFRALFLGACCLFLLTFVINTLAEILRQRLRERYKVV